MAGGRWQWQGQGQAEASGSNSLMDQMRIQCNYLIDRPRHSCESSHRHKLHAEERWSTFWSCLSHTMCPRRCCMHLIVRRDFQAIAPPAKSMARPCDGFGRMCARPCELCQGTGGPQSAVRCCGVFRGVFSPLSVLRTWTGSFCSYVCVVVCCMLLC